MSDDKKKILTTYSCRAEVSCDAIRVLHVLSDDSDVDADAGAKLCFMKYDGETDGLEFRSTHSLDELLVLFRRVVDTHVMQQTLRAVPLAENSLERVCAECGDNRLVTCAECGASRRYGDSIVMHIRWEVDMWAHLASADWEKDDYDQKEWDLYVTFCSVECHDAAATRDYDGPRGDWD